MTANLPVDHPSRRRRALPALAAGVVLLLVVGLGALVAIRGARNFEIDQEWMAEIVEHRNPFWEVPSLIFNTVGGGWIAVILVPVGVAIVLLVTKRPWSALYWVLVVGISALLVQVLKELFGRARPEDILVTADFGSFPSGHTANAATVAVALALILRRVWVSVLGVVLVLAMALSRTYLGAHWVTDTVGGALLGAAVAVLIWTVFAVPMRRERFRRGDQTSGDVKAGGDATPEVIARG